MSVSVTTRPPRPGEVDGQHYHFVSHDRFRDMIAAGEMLEHAEVFGNLYGSPRGPTEAALAQGRDVLFDVDWQGGQQIGRSALARDVVSVFILPPSIAELERRLRERAQDSDAVIAGRMTRSRDEISHWGEYQYVIVNRDIDTAEAALRTLITAERARADRQPWLNDFVRALNAEFEDRIGAAP